MLIKLDLWDITSDDSVKTLDKHCYMNLMGILLIINAGLSNFEDEIAKWLKKIKQNIQNDLVPIIIAANKIDLVDDENKLLMLKSKYGSQLIFTSAKEGFLIKELFYELIYRIIDYIKVQTINEHLK